MLISNNILCLKKITFMVYSTPRILKRTKNFELVFKDNLYTQTHIYKYA